MKMMNPAIPIMSGARMCADDQGKLMPPKVKAMLIEQVAAMTKKLPLQINHGNNSSTALK